MVGTCMNDEICLLMLWVDVCISQQSNLTNEKNLQYHNDSTTKLARTGSAEGTESGVLNR